MIEQLLSDIHAEFRRLADPQVRAALDRFSQPDQRTASYGIAAPAIKQLAQNTYRCMRTWPVTDRDRLCEELWKSGTNEDGALVCYVYRRFARQCGAREFRMFTRWLDHYVNNWGQTDGLSLWLLGASIANDPTLIARLDPWTRSRNRWKRRAAAVSLVPSARRGLHTRDIFRIAGPLIPDRDDMVQKGVGWLLKETYPKKPAEVVRFLLPHRDQAPRLVLRYAAEKMTVSDKARVLAR
jgi:3-methyladenine DNA glycosylase AlkD